MASNTKIEWTDASWQPVVGCTKVSPGCKNCYAERMAGRLANMHQIKYMSVVEQKAGTGTIKYNKKAVYLQEWNGKDPWHNVDDTKRIAELTESFNHVQDKKVAAEKEIKRLNTIIENRAEDKEVLERYKTLKAKLARIKEVLVYPYSAQMRESKIAEIINELEAKFNGK